MISAHGFLGLTFVWLAYLCEWSVASDAPARRLHVSSLTVRLASKAEKDGLTFTGSYPSTVLNEQQLEIDTELIVSFEVTNTDEPNKAITPQQCFLMVQSNSVDVATYIAARAKNGKQSVSTDVKYLLQQLGQHERVELSLIVGDPRFSEGVVWSLGALKMRSTLLKESGIQRPPLPRRLHEQPAKPEIEHLFREPDAQPPAALSLFFACLSFCPLFGWIVYMQRIGINLKGLPSASSRAWVFLFHISLALILMLYAVFFFRLNLIQMIVPLGVLCGFAFITGHQTLCAVAGTHVKEKTA